MRENPQLLIVDDEPMARRTMEMLLLREGYELVFAEDAYSALAQLDDELPDLILMDVMMPGMDGFELCDKVKRNPNWRHVPIILVTALDSKQDLAQGIDAGADDFLHKPYNGLELRARVRSLLRIKQRHDELQEALQLRQDLSNMIVHDIRGPLSSIMIYCDLLLQELGGASETVDVIRNEAARLSGFLTDMLMMAKMEHGRLRLMLTEVDLNELLTAVCETYVPMAALKEIHVVRQVESTSCPVTVDANLMRRVLDNLVSNAIKFSPKASTITLKLAAESRGAGVTITVADEGPGIPAEFRETVFNKFQIIASKRRDVAQVGLGLAFCKMVVDAHDGRIVVDENTPQGAIFTVTLPGSDVVS
jgi:signal transduction histidine kinase